MSIIRKLTERIAERRAKRLFPRVKEDFWYCGAIYMYRHKLYMAGKSHKMGEIELPCEEFLINPYQNAGGKVPREGDIIPCMKVGEWVGCYLVTRKWCPSPLGDFAEWDDGGYVNLRLHHCERAGMPGGGA